MSKMADAIYALLAYGFELQGDRYVKPGRGTQQWVARDDGFLRYEANGDPCPFSVNEKGQGLAGLNPLNPAQAEFFEWVWPAAQVEAIYSHATEQRDAGWPDLRTEDDKAADAAGGRLAQEASVE